jgi:hypothetical protein
MTRRAVSARPYDAAAEVRKFEKQRVENKSTYWLIFELTWRDFYKFFAIKHGDNIFGSEGRAAQLYPRFTPGPPQIDFKSTPSCPRFDRAWYQGYNLRSDVSLSKIAFIFNVRLYMKAPPRRAAGVVSLRAALGNGGSTRRR